MNDSHWTQNTSWRRVVICIGQSLLPWTMWVQLMSCLLVWSRESLVVFSAFLLVALVELNERSRFHIRDFPSTPLACHMQQ